MPGQVAAGAHERVAVEDVEDAGDGQQHVVRTDLDLAVDPARAALVAGAARVLARAVEAGTVAVASAAPAAAAATGTVVVEVAVALLAVALSALRAVVLSALLTVALLAVALLAVALLAVALLTVALLAVVLLAVVLLAVVLLARRPAGGRSAGGRCAGAHGAALAGRSLGLPLRLGRVDRCAVLAGLLRGALRRLARGVVAGRAAAAAAGDSGATWRSLMAEMRSALRMPDAPEMPSWPASDLSSGSSIPDRPLERRAGGAGVVLGGLGHREKPFRDGGVLARSSGRRVRGWPPIASEDPEVSTKGASECLLGGVEEIFRAEGFPARRTDPRPGCGPRCVPE